jgi:hypothetical protein
MGKRQPPERSALAAELQALLGAGDQRSARARAREILAGAAAGDADRQAARAVLARVEPDRGVAVVAAVGLALFAVVAVLGLFLRA